MQCSAVQCSAVRGSTVQCSAQCNRHLVTQSRCRKSISSSLWLRVFCRTVQWILSSSVVYNSKFVQLYSCRNIQLFSCKTAQLYNCTTVQLDRCLQLGPESHWTGDLRASEGLCAHSIIVPWGKTFNCNSQKQLGANSMGA